MCSDKNNENYLQSRQDSQSTPDNATSTLKVTLSSSLFEGFSSVTSVNSNRYYLDINHENEKWKDLLVFMYTEPSIMLYSNVFLIVSRLNI